MKPILHSAAAWAAAEQKSIRDGTMTAINAEMESNGVGVLTDCISCLVSEERNAEYELTLVYPVEGAHYADLRQRAVIMAKPNPISDSQPFRIYRITRPLSGKVTVYAQHLSYDLDGITLKPFSCDTAPQTFRAIPSQAMTPNLYTFWTDKTTEGKFSYTEPKTVRQILGGESGSILDVCGSGDYEFDRYTVRFHTDRGADRGVTIRYGKNLTDIKQEENCSSVCTGIVPYWTDSDGNTMFLESDPIVKAEGTYDFTRTKPVDFSEEFDDRPTEDQLRAAAERYVKANKIGIPTVSLDVSFVQLEQSEEYKDIAQLERVLLCDTVTVQFEKLGVHATARINKTEFDVLKNRYKSVEIGDAQVNLAETINRLSEEIQQQARKRNSAMQDAISKATELITGNRGGYVILHSSTGGQAPDEILIMDTPDIKTAQKVWRWNHAGLGYSSTGYNGTFGLAMTIDGQIVADFITAGVLSASLLKTGVFEVTDANGNTLFSADSDNNKVRIGNWWVSGNRRGLYANWTSENVRCRVSPEYSADANFLELTVNDETRFSVTGQGILHAIGAAIEGELTSASGTIGGWTLSDNALTSQNGQIRSTGTVDIDGTEHSAESRLTASSLRFMIDGGTTLLIRPEIESVIELDQSGSEAIEIEATAFRAVHPLQIYLGMSETSPAFDYGGQSGSMVDEFNFYSKTWGWQFFIPTETTTSAAYCGLTSSGQLRKYASGSSKRYKHDISYDLDTAFDPEALYNLPIAQFVFNDEYLDTDDPLSGTPIIGIIAEDMHEHYPAAASYNADGSVESWDTRRLVPAMLKLIQNQHREMEQIKRQLAALTEGGCA